MNEVKFNKTYYFADLVESCIYEDLNFWNYSPKVFILRSSNFNKETLLHHFIETTIWNYYNSAFNEFGGFYEEDEEFLDFLRSLFKTYDISIDFFDDVVDTELSEDLYKDFLKWWNNNEEIFRQLFNKIADEVFYIFFGNRNLLLHFNILVSELVKNTRYPQENITFSGKIRRKNAPVWVKKAVFLRDKGRCTNCTGDLTGLIATDTKQHYDHIVPLNQYGVNDPSNIQLLCETCNLKKSGSIIETSELYSKWWD